MDLRTVAISSTLVGTALCFQMLFTASGRRNRGLWILTAGFFGGLAGLFLLDSSSGPSLPLLTLAHFFLLFFQFALPWGMRSYGGERVVWPARFWIYLGTWIAVTLLSLNHRLENQVRSVLFSLLAIILAGEFLLSLSRLPAARGKTFGSAAAVGLAFMAFHGLRIAVALESWSGPASGMTADTMTAYTFGLTILFAVLCSGLIRAVDAGTLLSQLTEKNRILEGIATTDGLTGLANRRLLEESLGAEMGRSTRYGEPLSLVMLDLDHFKKVNDTHGHQVGDEVLKRAAAAVRRHIREPDSAYRWGGEEFLVLLPHTGRAGAMIVAEKLRRAVSAEPHPVAGRITASFGVAEFRPRDTREDWIGRADQALYRAKNEGRDRVVADEAVPQGVGTLVRISWRPEWESGDAMIDREHRELVELANGLLEASLAAEDRQRLTDLVDGLISHVGRHFSDEEGLLAERGWQGLSTHAALHRELVSRAVALRAELVSSGVEPAVLFAFLVDRVIVGHMIHADQGYFSYLQGRSAC